MEKNYPVYFQKEVDLLLQMGRVINLWSLLENQLLEVSSWTLKMPTRQAAGVMAQFKTFRMALDFTRSMCQTTLADTKYMNSLMDLIAEVSGDRNFIAHTSVVANGEGDPAEADWALAFPTVGPSMSHYYGASTDKREPMEISEVREIAADVQFLIEALIEFRQMLFSTPATWPDKYLKTIESRRPRISARRSTGDKTGA